MARPYTMCPCSLLSGSAARPVLDLTPPSGPFLQWCYLFSVVLLGDPFTASRVGAVLLAVVGVTVLTLGGGDNNAAARSSMQEQLTGNLFVLVGAVGYALYEVLTEMRVFKGRRSTLIANALCGTIGFMNMVCGWPIIILLSALPTGGGWDWVKEPFELPSTEALFFILINLALALAFNFAFLISITYTSPLITSVGCMLTIPLSAVCDAILFGDTFPPSAVVGSVFVVGGFGLLTWADHRGHGRTSQVAKGGEYGAVELQPGAELT